MLPRISGLAALRDFPNSQKDEALFSLPETRLAQVSLPMPTGLPGLPAATLAAEAVKAVYTRAPALGLIGLAGALVSSAAEHILPRLSGDLPSNVSTREIQMASVAMSDLKIDDLPHLTRDQKGFFVKTAASLVESQRGGAAPSQNYLAALRMLLKQAGNISPTGIRTIAPDEADRMFGLRPQNAPPSLPTRSSFPRPAARDDEFDPNATPESGPELAFEQSTGQRERADGSLEASVMMSPPDNRSEGALPDPLSEGGQTPSDASEAIIHVAGAPPVDFARRQRLTGFRDGKAPEDEQGRMDILVRLYSHGSDTLQTARVKKLAATTKREVEENVAPEQFDKVDKHGNSWSQMTEADYAVLNMYISGFFEFNPALGGNFQRVMKPPGRLSERAPTIVRDTLQAAEVLAQTLAKVPIFEGTAHRGFKLSSQELDVFQPGKVVYVPVFMSASLGRAPAPPFDAMPVIFSITGEAANIDPANGREREVIFAPGNYAVLDRREVGGQTFIRLRQLE